MTNSSSCDSCGQPHGQWATDRLTLLLDRWGWDAEAPRILASSPSTALVVVDLDNFKRVNDRHGHVAGDAVLKSVADTLRQHTRKSDLVGRYGGHGGDEFLVLLPDTSMDEAVTVTERIRQSIRSLRVHAPVRGGTITIESITASFGVAVGGPGADLEDLIVEADTALRRAKRTGRGRIRTTARRSLRIPVALMSACAAGIVVVSMVSDSPSVSQAAAPTPPAPPPPPTVTLPPVTVPTTVTMTATVQPPPRPGTLRPRPTPARSSSSPTEAPAARSVERPPTSSTRPCVVCTMVHEAVEGLRQVIR